MEAKIGIRSAFTSKMVEQLSIFLADEFVLSVKTKNAHWNIEGQDFYEKHLFFEQQFKQLDELTDDIAEYIRTLGHYATATLNSFLHLTHFTEQQVQLNNGNEFVKELLADHESIIIRLREIDHFADEMNSTESNDFIVGIMKKHEKMAWMLRAQLK